MKMTIESILAPNFGNLIIAPASSPGQGDPANPTSEELALTVEILERLTRRIDNAARKAVMNKRGGTPYKQFGVPRSKHGPANKRRQRHDPGIESVGVYSGATADRGK